MTKEELLKALEPFDNEDDINIIVPTYYDVNETWYSITAVQSNYTNGETQIGLGEN